MRVRFLDRFDWPVTSMVTFAYKAGQERTVIRRCGSKAVAAGRAVEIDPPPRKA